jgi:hypothetical protein
MNDSKRAEAKIKARRIMIHGAATTWADAKWLYEFIDTIPTINGEPSKLTNERPYARQ